MLKKIESFKQLETMAVLSLACLVFGIFLKVSLLLYVGAGLLFTGLFLKRISGIVAGAWLRFAAFLGAINTKILLSVMFYLILTPLAWMFRLFKGDILHIGKNEKVATYWTEHEKEYAPSDLEKMW